MDTLTLLIGLALAAVIAVLLFLLQQARSHGASAAARLTDREQDLARQAESLTRVEAERSRLAEELQNRREELASLRTSLDLERKQAGEKLSLLENSREQLTVAFKNIANEIFEDKSRKFTASSKEAIAHVLSPLQDKISRFEKRVEETYDRESKDRFSLVKEIKNLQELNARISEDAVNLTNALKGDNKTQGNWGEFILESILERSGLVKGREYEVQVSLKAEEGDKYQPDVVVHLPESRDIIIDSKVSLKAWDEYSCCEETGRRAELLSAHVQSIRSHVRGLSGKNYQDLQGINTLDYVFLFMPIEAAYSEASRSDPELLQFAYEKNIILVGPSTLLTALKMVQNLWRLAQQNQNATEIAQHAGRLYDKFVGFVADLEDLGQRLDTTRKSYDKAFNKLRTGHGNLVGRVEKLKEMGAKANKQLDKAMVEAARAEEGGSSERLSKLASEQDDGDDADETTTH